MKILHLCLSCFYIDNYSYQENMLPKYHRLMGHDVTVIASLVSFDKNGNTCLLSRSGDYLSDDGYKVVRLKYKGSFKHIYRTLRIYRNTYREIVKSNPDIIFIHGSQFWDIRQVVRYIKKHLYVRVFVDNHGDFLNSGSNWISRNILHKVIWRYFARRILPYTEKFYGVTPLRCEFLRDVYHLPGNKVELLVMGADDKRIDFDHKSQIRKAIREKLGISNSDFVMVTGGKIDEKKKIHLLMQAVSEMKNKDIRLIVFGNSNQAMKPVIETLSKSDRIRYIGWIDSYKAYDFFLASDLAVFPGTHSVLWEQVVGTGIPAVFRYWSGMDHVDVGGNCRFLHTSEKSEIKKVIEDIINNKAKYEIMKRASEEKGIKEFSYSEISKKAIGH